MNPEITREIEARREALYRHYDLPPGARSRAEELFRRMEMLGRECRDREEFERSLSCRTLGSEYNSLLVDFSAYVRPAKDGTTNF